VIDKWLEWLEAPIPKSLINEIDVDFEVNFEVSGRAEMKKLLSFEDLVEVTVSLINEPFEPPPLSARQKATQRWRLV
jgi:hypothetical protein